MQLPLTQWTLHGEDLPERLFDTQKAHVFSLPGADALYAFADLIGAHEQQETEKIQDGVPYTLSGLFEADLCGELSLTKEIDFGAFCGDRALLTFSYLAGSGEIYLGEGCIARFGQNHMGDLRSAFDMTGMPCALCVDVSDALRLGRRETLSLRFDASRPAGVMGAVCLSVTSRAYLSRVSVRPDPAHRTMTVCARISAQQAGRFVLRAQAVPGGAGAPLPPAREIDVTLEAGQTRGAELAMSVDAPVFVPGHAYASPAMKIQLFARSDREKGDGFLCDETLLLCGYGGKAPRAYLPLDTDACLGDADALCKSLLEMGIYAVSVPMSAPDALYIHLTRAGIAAVGHISEEIRPAYTRYPCLTLTDAPLPQENPSPAAAAWQMTGSVAYPRAIDRTMTDEELFLEASGKRLDMQAQNVCDTLAWLRVVQIRMRAEAARQGRYQGALCSVQEGCRRDVMDALHAAFAPVHLSALPLSGAWWTGTHFSASLEAFIPDEMAGKEEIQACAVLEDDDGKELARFLAPCRRGGYMGVIEARLPEIPCVLTLRCAMLRQGEAIEESVLPVYVGMSGPLEAAFLVL